MPKIIESFTLHFWKHDISTLLHANKEHKYFLQIKPFLVHLKHYDFVDM